MNSKTFSQAMNQIDSRYIQEALHCQKIARRPLWLKRIAIAACLAIAISIGAVFLSQQGQETAPRLPMLSVSEHTAEGMGFEGYMAYSASQLVDANPWSENPDISALPVYRNPLTRGEDGIAANVDFHKMRVSLLELAERLGLDTEKLTIADDAQDINPTVTAEADGLTIEVDETMTATVSFDPAVSLPDGYNFTDYAPYEDAAAAAEYLKTKYRDVMGFDNPQANIRGGDYTFDARQAYSIEFFNGDENPIQRMVDYNFNQVQFCCDDEGNLSLMRIYQPDLSQKAGDYPIITSGQARKLLAKGNYLTTVPCEMPGLEYVKKTELIYRTGKYEAYYMPYYRFYVELPEELQENGLKTYGAYYVPAVEPTYISNMPTWDGRFN